MKERTYLPFSKLKSESFLTVKEKGVLPYVRLLCHVCLDLYFHANAIKVNKYDEFNP